MAPKNEDFNKKMTKKDIKNDFITYFINYGLSSDEMATEKGPLNTMIYTIGQVNRNASKGLKRYNDKELEYLISLAKIVAMRDYIVDSEEYQNGMENPQPNMVGDVENECENKFVRDLNRLEDRAVTLDKGGLGNRNAYRNNPRGYLKETITNALKNGYDATPEQIEKVFDVSHCLVFNGTQYDLNYNGLWEDYVNDNTVELKQHARDERRQRAIEKQIEKAKLDAEKDITSALNDVNKDDVNIVDKNATMSVINQIAKDRMTNSLLKRIPVLRWLSPSFRKEYAAFQKTNEELAKVDIDPEDIGKYLKDTERTAVDLYDLCVSDKIKEKYAESLKDYDLKLNPEPKEGVKSNPWREPEDLKLNKSLSESLVDMNTVVSKDVKDLGFSTKAEKNINSLQN